MAATACVLVCLLTSAYAYTIPTIYTATGTQTSIAIAIEAHVRIGDSPGKDVVFSSFNYTPNAQTTLQALSCEYSSFCTNVSGTLRDYAYVPVARLVFDYTIDAESTLALWHGSPWWPADSFIAHCPYKEGFLVGTRLHHHDVKCYDRIVTPKHRTWLPCVTSPFTCTINAQYNTVAVSLFLSLEDPHIRVSADLGICTNCYLVVGDYIIAIDGTDSVTFSDLVRPLIIVDTTLPTNTIRLGVAGDNIAYTWIADTIYIHTAWDRDTQLTIVDFVVGSILLYTIKVWFSWIQTQRQYPFSQRVVYGLAGTELIGMSTSLVVCILHTTAYNLANRIYRVADAFTPETATIYTYMIIAMISLQFCIHLYVLVRVVLYNSDDKYAHLRKYCFEVNTLVALAIILINTHVVGFINVLLTMIAVLLLYNRHKLVYKTNIAWFMWAYFTLYIFATCVLFNPIMSSMSGFAQNVVFATFVTSAFVVCLPSMLKHMM